MIEAAIDGLLGILHWRALLFLAVGVIVSSTLVAMPGVGSKTAIVLMLPFAFLLNPFEAIALIVGVWAVSNTANSITSILFGVPGGGGSQATIMDGYPMARKGEAARALSAAFSASALGGWIGALVLLLAIPVLRPVSLLLGPPEFFMLILMGVGMVGVLSGRAPLKGIIAGALGLALTMIGVQEITGLSRYTFGNLYLMDGIGLVPLAIGLFAIPEMIALVTTGGPIGTPLGDIRRGMGQGLRDTAHHWWLVIRSSVLGVWIGIIPGLGSSVADWFAYGQAKQTCPGASETFGKGDVRGVIAVDAATNAKEGGALIPTIAFGIPGSSTLALIFGGLVIVGVTPGREMLTTRLDFTFSLIWLLIIGNLMASALCLAFTPQLAQITRLRPSILAPLILAMAVVGSFAASNRFEDVLTMLAFGVLGYLMRAWGWPRPPLLIGVVLGALAERHFWTSMQLFGLSFLERPGVVLIAILLVVSLLYPLLQGRRRTAVAAREAAAGAGADGG